MPWYDYMCNACGHEFEELRPYNPDERAIECPHECGMKATRLPSAGSYRGNFGTGSTPKRAGAALKQTKAPKVSE